MIIQAEFIADEPVRTAEDAAEPSISRLPFRARFAAAQRFQGAAQRTAFWDFLRLNGLWRQLLRRSFAIITPLDYAFAPGYLLLARKMFSVSIRY